MIKISIVTIIYNPNIDELKKNLISIYNQNFKNIEHIIQDGSENNNASKFINKFMIENKKNKIKYFHENDLGVYDALNKGISKCKGDIIGMLHCDDAFYDKNVLSTVANNFSGSVDVIYGDLIYTNKANKIIRKWKSGLFDKSKLKFGWMPPHTTMFIKYEIFKKHGVYNHIYKIAGDYDFILRILKIDDITVKYISKILINMKLGGASNKSLRNILLKSYEDFKALKNNEIGGIFTLFMKNIRKINQFI